jgi:uncharacterized protein (TIGR00251 family)
MCSRGKRHFRSASQAVIPIQESARGLTFAVKVHPRARRNAITGTIGDALKLALTAQPVNGKANHAVVDFFADFFQIPRASITIASGATSRNKIVRISGVTAEQVRNRFAAATAR